MNPEEYGRMFDAEETQWWYAVANVGAELGVGLACMFAGFALGRLL